MLFALHLTLQSSLASLLSVTEIGPLVKLSSFPVAGFLSPERDTGELRAGGGSRLSAEFWPTLDTPGMQTMGEGWRGTCQALIAWCLSFPEPAAPVCAAARVALGPRELWGSGEPLSWCAVLHLSVGLLKLNPTQLCLCLRHSWSRFFPCFPLWLCCIYPVYYSFICTELKFFLLLSGMRICSMGYKAMLVPACLELKNIPEPLRVTCSEGLSPQPSTSLLKALDRALPRHLCSPPWLSALAGITVDFQCQKESQKSFFLPWPCTWMVAFLMIRNPGSGSVPLGLMLQMVMLL